MLWHRHARGRPCEAVAAFARRSLLGSVRHAVSARLCIWPCGWSGSSTPYRTASWIDRGRGIRSRRRPQIITVMEIMGGKATAVLCAANTRAPDRRRCLPSLRLLLPLFLLASRDVKTAAASSSAVCSRRAGRSLRGRTASKRAQTPGLATSLSVRLVLGSLMRCGKRCSGPSNRLWGKLHARRQGGVDGLLRRTCR